MANTNPQMNPLTTGIPQTEAKSPPAQQIPAASPPQINYRNNDGVKGTAENPPLVQQPLPSQAVVPQQADIQPPAQQIPAASPPQINQQPVVERVVIDHESLPMGASGRIEPPPPRSRRVSQRLSFFLSYQLAWIIGIVLTASVGIALFWVVSRDMSIKDVIMKSQQDGTVMTIPVATDDKATEALIRAATATDGLVALNNKVANLTGTQQPIVSGNKALMIPACTTEGEIACKVRQTAVFVRLEDPTRNLVTRGLLSQEQLDAAIAVACTCGK